VKSTPPNAGEPFRANPVLRTGDSADGRRRRLPVVASAILHIVLVAAFLVLPGPFMKDDEPEPLKIVFYSPEELERPVELPPEPPEPQPEPIEVAELRPVVPPPPAPKPPAKPVERIVRHEPEPVPKPLPPVPEPAKPKPEVRTDVFKADTPAEPTVVASRKLARTGAFGEAETKPGAPLAPRSDRTVQTVGDFSDDASDDPKAPTGQRDTRVVASSSFGDEAMAVPREGQPARRGGTVTQTAFVSEAADEPATPRATGEVNRGGFEVEEAAARPAGQRRRTVEGEEPDSPVEIVSKARPVYTEQARELRIEGEVVLEVTFVATGQLRIVRVVGSLGHGLDEAAVDAAKKIEFTPARRNGRPVDHTATLRVVFRLA
jgi:TonB family protein